MATDKAKSPPLPTIDKLVKVKAALCVADPVVFKVKVLEAAILIAVLIAIAPPPPMRDKLVIFANELAVLSAAFVLIVKVPVSAVLPITKVLALILAKELLFKVKALEAVPPTSIALDVVYGCNVTVETATAAPIEITSPVRVKDPKEAVIVAPVEMTIPEVPVEINVRLLAVLQLKLLCTLINPVVLVPAPVLVVVVKVTDPFSRAAERSAALIVEFLVGIKEVVELGNAGLLEEPLMVMVYGSINHIPPLPEIITPCVLSTYPEVSINPPDPIPALNAWLALIVVASSMLV